MARTTLHHVVVPIETSFDPQNTKKTNFEEEEEEGQQQQQQQQQPQPQMPRTCRSAFQPFSRWFDCP